MTLMVHPPGGVLLMPPYNKPPSLYVPLMDYKYTNEILQSTANQ